MTGILIKNEADFYDALINESNLEKRFFAKLNKQLEELDGEYDYQAGITNENVIQLIMTAAGNIKNIAFIEGLVNEAPDLQNWNFTVLKPQSAPSNLEIGFRGFDFNCYNIYYYTNEDPDYPEDINITILYEGITEENRESVSAGILMFLDDYLGEKNFLEIIDNKYIIDKSEAEKDVLSITKLPEYLAEKQKQYLDKYKGSRLIKEQDKYFGFKAQMPEGWPIIGTMNSAALDWDSKASHPWLMSVIIRFDPKLNNGFPDDKISTLLDELQDDLFKELKDSDGYIHIGRLTVGGTRAEYYACIDYRLPSKVGVNLQKKYGARFVVEIEFFKDKYWRSFERYRV